MASLNLILALSCLFCGTTIILVSFPLLKGRVALNNWYGIRLQKAYESEENWYKINRYGALQFIRWSLGLIAFSAFIIFLPLEGRPVPVLAAALAPLWFLLPPIVATIRYANKL